MGFFDTLKKGAIEFSKDIEKYQKGKKEGKNVPIVVKFDLNKEKKEISKEKPISKKEIEKKKTEIEIKKTISKKEDKLQNDFRKVLRFLRSEDVSFHWSKNKKEKHFESELVGMLRFGLKKFDTGYQKIIGRSTVDILINNSLGIELKLHLGGKDTATRLFRQVAEYYPNPCKKIVAFIINHSNQENKIVEKDVSSLIKKLNIPKGDFAVIVKKV